MLESSADISDCGRFRWKLVRRWDARPMLLVAMFNPSFANGTRSDNTMDLLSHIASWNGFGGVTVVNLSPLITSVPAGAIDMLLNWKDRSDVLENHRVIGAEAVKAVDVLVAWGAIAARTPGHDKHALSVIKTACPHARLWCLGRTAEGHPIHPLARGKHKVPKDRKFIEWKEAA